MVLYKDDAMISFIKGFEKKAKLEEKIRGGKADDKPASKYPDSQIQKGVKIEMEHTNDKGLAREISRDHLEENKKYYTHLEKMEKDMDKKGSDVKRKKKDVRVGSDPNTGYSHILAESETVYE